jgi:hypothetical protein
MQRCAFASAGETGDFKCLTYQPQAPARSGAFFGALVPFLAALPVFGRGDEFAHGMPRLPPTGESIKDDSYGGQSPLCELYIASRLLLNSFPLRFEKISRFLQLPD